MSDRRRPASAAPAVRPCAHITSSPRPVASWIARPPTASPSRRALSQDLGRLLLSVLPFLALPVGEAGAQRTPTTPTAEGAEAPRGAAFAIPAGPLAVTLARFQREAGVSLSDPGGLSAGLESPGLSGSFSVAEAWPRLLQGTGLAAVSREGGGWTLVRRSASPAAADTGAPQGTGPATMPPVRVVAGPDQETATGPVRGYTARRSATGTRTDVAMLDTPVSVQTVTRDVIEDQRVERLTDALSNVSGVYAAHGPDGNTMDAFVIRGFQVDSYGASYLDGVKDFSRSPKEMAGLERVEVLKGPGAIMYGRIEPGGMINRVSKRPQAEGFTRIGQEIGSHRHFRTTLDSTGALDADGRWLYRMNAAVVEQDGFISDTHNRRLYLAPQLEWRPNAVTAVRVGFDYLKEKRSWALTYGTIGDSRGPVRIPIRTNLLGRGDYYREESGTFRVEASHRLNEQWEIRQRASYGQRRSRSEGSGLTGADDEGNYERDFWGWGGEHSRVVSTNLELQGRLNTGPLKHTLLLGGDYYTENYDSGGWQYGGTPVLTNIHAPDNSVGYRADADNVPYQYGRRNAGFFAQDQIALLDDRVHLLLGLRHDKARYQYTYDQTSMVANDSKTTWRVGLLYKLRPELSVYTSHVTGFGSSQFDWSTASAFPPQTSKQTEVGVKFQPTPRFNVTVAAFELIKDNLTMADPADVRRTILAGEARSRGLELDVSGRIGRSWDVIASYAFTDVKYTRSDYYQGERMMGVPRHGASLWGTYRFEGTGWRAGAGVVYRSSMIGTQRAFSEDLYPYTLAGYTLLNAMVSYDFKLAGRNARLQLNGSNLTDRRYNPTTYGGTSRIGLGAPRSLVASVSMSF